MSSTQQTSRGKSTEDFHALTNAVIAAKASKGISKAALVWALKHVVQPGDCITLVIVVSPRKPGKRLWAFPRFSGDSTDDLKKQQTSASLGQKCDITDSCSRMMLQLHDVYGSDKIIVRIKVVAGAPCGAVAEEAKRIGAKWVVLDKHLKHEEKRCMEELQCNIVSMKRSQPKVLRLSLREPQQLPCQNSNLDASSRDSSNNTEGHQSSTGIPIVMPTSSSEVGTPFTSTDGGISSGTSSDPGNYPVFVFKTIGRLKKEHQIGTEEIQNLDVVSSDSDSENLSLSRETLQPCINKIISIGKTSSKELEDVIEGLNKKARISTANTLLEQSPKLDRETGIGLLNIRSYLSSSRNFREVILPSGNAPAGPPPLCSICQQKAPIFGKLPTRFTYSELELATDGFCQSNFLAEGGFGSVHRGVLSDGQAIAVKQHKLASTQGDQEFFSEMEVLSCAQHRNVVMLIGYCVEDGRRLLVYEYICNGSLDSHLYGCDREPLEWSARQKIAVGAARGLRYLHEECRIGCIVHRDMRPNNILITHDFEPSVGDFGLARWQPDGDHGEETRVLGTFGYLAPEYTQSGLITEKADVYSFGVVLLELVTGRRAIDINRPRKQQCLTEWARPLLTRYVTDELVDPRLRNKYCEQEVHRMLHAVTLCISHDPHTRPRISQVLRMLEGNIVIGPDYVSTPGYCSNRNRNTRTQNGKQWHRQQKIPALQEFSGVFGGKSSCRP